MSLHKTIETIDGNLIERIEILVIVHFLIRAIPTDISLSFSEN